MLSPFRQERQAERRAVAADILVILIIVQFVLETAVVASGNIFSLLAAGVIVGGVLAVAVRIDFIGDLIDLAALLIFFFRLFTTGPPGQGVMVFILIGVAVGAYFLLRFLSR
ncbi:MAG: hypothetical protein D6681_19825 [Calditrichaeota bacterium]|nr:MAG: hypothetical protein D6681_19825 [Calditrichota bacterium]